MRKIITLFAIAISLAGSAQKIDTVKPVKDTVYVFSAKDMEALKNIFMESKVIMNGQQLSGKEINQLFAWLDSKIAVFKREQPKKE